MTLLILLLLALLIGGVGLFFKALWWCFIIALVLILIGAISGYTRR